jgi:hypothetical protein
LQLAIASSLALVFAFLGGLHVFWALGGRLGFGSAVPEVDGKRAFMPTQAATFAVALALFAASVLVVGCKLVLHLFLFRPVLTRRLVRSC